MCLPHIRLQLFTLTPIFFYYITHVHLLQFSSLSIPDILCPPTPPSFARFCDTRISSKVRLQFSDLAVNITCLNIGVIS